MSGLHSQSRRKRDKRAVDMSASVDPAPGPTWAPPPPDECESSDPFSFFLADATGHEQTDHRIVVRMEQHVTTDQIVEFHIAHQTRQGGGWRDVATVDSCHNVDVHLHRYARSTYARIGEPEPLMELTCLADVGVGYERAYDTLTERWVENHRRWRDA